MSKAIQNPLEDSIKSILNLYSTGKIQEAFDKVEILKKSYPNNALLFNISGVCLKALGQFDNAIIHFKSSLEIKPDYFEVSYNLGLTFQQIGNFNNAVNNFRTAINFKPDYAEAHASLANALKQIGLIEEAISSYQKTISIKPNYAEAHNNLGNILMDIGQTNKAKKCFEKAINIKPDFAQAFNNLGNVMRDYGQLSVAYKLYRNAAKLKPNFAEVHNNLGIIFSELGQHHSAIESYSDAIAKKKNFAEAHANLGNAQKRLKRLNDATKSFNRAIEINPNAPYILGDLINTKMNLCQWDKLTKDVKELKKKINNNEKAIRPFASLALISNPMTQKKIAENFANSRFPKRIGFSSINNRGNGNKIRVGYFSPDFRNHAVASLISELFELHDRHQFEIHAFYFGPKTNDEMNLRIKSAVDFFHEVRSLGHKNVAMLSRKVKIDIAVDLCGYTQDCRPEIFAERAAPVQISYLGYPGTMGVNFMDYIIADQIIIPKKSQKHFSEKVIYMPNSYQVNISKKNLVLNQLTREDLGLPNSSFLFCCFNNSYKIQPSVFKSWMQILKNVDDSVLWLYSSDSSVTENLKREAFKFGISINRLFFATYKPGINNFSNHIKLVDLFLDSLPYNAHTMASDTLRMGVPVLTCVGKTLASRVAASLLNAVNMPELVSSSQEEYIAIATDLASNRLRYKQVKEKLIKNLPNAPLYNTSMFAKDLEAGYKIVYEKNQNAQSTDHIFIDSLKKT